MIKMVKKTKKGEHKWGRPPKMNRVWLDSAVKVISDWKKALYCTDEDLLFLINQNVDEKDRMSETTFKEYKAWKIKSTVDQETMKKFSSLYKNALVIQRELLFDKMEDSWPQSRTKFARILERKFREWNLININKNDNVNLNVNSSISELFDEADEEDKEKTDYVNFIWNSKPKCK